MADLDGPISSVVLEGTDSAGVEGPAAPSVPSGGRAKLGPAVVVLALVAVAGVLFLSGRSDGPEQAFLFVPPEANNTSRRPFGDLYFASLDEERTEKNLLLRNVSPQGEFISIPGDGLMERYDLFGMEYEGGQLVSYREDDSLNNAVLAHVDDGGLTEMAVAPGSPRVFQSSSGLFAFFEEGAGCEAFVFTGLEVVAVRGADVCLPAEHYFYLIDFDDDRRNVSRYDIEARELTLITEDEGPGQITVSYDGTVLVMTRFPSAAEGRQAPFIDAEIEVYTADSEGAVALDIDAIGDDVTRNLMRVFDNAVLIATSDPDEPGRPLLYVPVDGSAAFEVDEALFGLAIANQTEDALANPDLDALQIINLPDFEVFEFETDGFETGGWVDSETFVWVDQSGIVREASTDGTGGTVGEIGPFVFVDARLENERLLIMGEFVASERTQFLYSDTNGLVDLDFTSFPIIDGPRDSTIAVAFDINFSLDANSARSAVGLVDPETGDFEPFDEQDGFIGGVSTNGSYVTYLVSGPGDDDEVATHVADLSDLDAIEVEEYEDVVQLGSNPTTSNWEPWLSTIQR